MLALASAHAAHSHAVSRRSLLIPRPPRADDHRNASIYFREQQNQNLQRVRLADLQLGPGSAIVTLPMGPTNQLAWWSDAVPSFHKV